MTAKKSFIGCTGISPDIGMVTEMVSEVNLNQMMFQRVTGASYILADSSKFGERAGGVSWSAGENRKYYHGHERPGGYAP